jgi:hypothetical protein
MSIEGALPPHPPPLEPTPSYAVKEMLTEANIEALNDGLADHGVHPDQIISIQYRRMLGSARYHIFYKGTPT